VNKILVQDAEDATEVCIRVVLLPKRAKLWTLEASAIRSGDRHPIGDEDAEMVIACSHRADAETATRDLLAKSAKR